MKATEFEFRYRMWLIVVLIVLGFWSPGIQLLGTEASTIAWLWLSHQVGTLVNNPILGFVIVNWTAIALAAIGWALRLWGTAFLGAGTVFSRAMKAGSVMANGPYRYVRNPLYIGSWFMVAPISMLMPTVSAAIVLILLAFFEVRLILGEEAFLTAKLGEPYSAYLNAVPRLFPLLRSPVRSSGQAPRWGHALLAEIMPLGVLVSFAALSWQYNADYLGRALLVSFGLSLVIRALIAPNASGPLPSA